MAWGPKAAPLSAAGSLESCQPNQSIRTSRGQRGSRSPSCSNSRVRKSRSVGAQPASTPDLKPPLPLLREGQYSAGKRMPPRAGADRQVQHLDRNQRRATEHIDGMRPPTGAPIENDCGREQQIGGQRRKQGYRDGWRSGGPGRRQKGKEPASYRRVQKRNRSKQHQPFVALGPSYGCDGQAKRHGKEQDAAQRDDRKGNAFILQPHRRRGLHQVDAYQHAEDGHRGREGYSDHAGRTVVRDPSRGGEPGLEAKKQGPAEKYQPVDVDDRVRLE